MYGNKHGKQVMRLMIDVHTWEQQTVGSLRQHWRTTSQTWDIGARTLTLADQQQQDVLRKLASGNDNTLHEH